VVFTYLDVFGRDKEEVEALKKDYIAGRLGDVAAKEKLTEILNEFLDPIRERRRYYEGRPEEVLEILKTGTSHARGIAAETLEKVKEAMGISYFKG
jgi:tryptophanyl-tRNA synthetase